MTRLRIDLSYHGAEFAGWAAQPGRRTVETELAEALRTALGESIDLTVAGRTDAGVHALGQVVSLEVAEPPEDDLRRALNGMTGDDIVVRAVTEADPDFDARDDARSRLYCYRVLASRLPDPFERGLSLWWPYPHDPGALDTCAAAVLGEHDFTAFTPTQTEHVHFERRIIRAEWVREPAGMLAFWIEADAFMRNMVRVLVGTMLEVAQQRRTPEDFRSLLEGAPRESAGDTAQPHGLYLVEVRY